MRGEFDPRVVGEAEVGWWRAHNEHKKELMLEMLIGEHSELYGFSAEEAGVALKGLFEAALLHDKRNWDGSRREATKYYQAIKDKTGLGFDPGEMAGLEVGWWIMHDELEFVDDKTRLADAFARLYAAQFGLEQKKLSQAGKLKAQATKSHDLAEREGVSKDEAEKHWGRAGDLLVEFYEELKRVVNG